MIFVDTNVYFYARDDRRPTERERCASWLRSIAVARCGAANLQVANEFIHIVRRKMPWFSPQDVFDMADNILTWGDAAITRSTMSDATRIHRQHRYSWWDCLLIASALELRCKHFLSEDLQDGQTIDGLTIVSPFAHSPDQILLSR